MDNEGSITCLLGRLKDGDELAADQICKRCYRQLLAVAHRKLANVPRRVEDEEDAVQAALVSFVDSARRGCFPQLENRKHLWRLLLTITERKAINQRNRYLTHKRGSGRVRGDSVFLEGRRDEESPGRVQLESRDPSPAVLAVMSEDLRNLLGRLDSEMLRSVALMKFQGYTNAEIAQELDVVERTIERKLSLIRSQLVDDVGGS